MYFTAHLLRKDLTTFIQLFAYNEVMLWLMSSWCGRWWSPQPECSLTCPYSLPDSLLALVFWATLHHRRSIYGLVLCNTAALEGINFPASLIKQPSPGRHSRSSGAGFKCTGGRGRSIKFLREGLALPYWRPRKQYCQGGGTGWKQRACADTTARCRAHANKVASEGKHSSCQQVRDELLTQRIGTKLDLPREKGSGGGWNEGWGEDTRRQREMRLTRSLEREGMSALLERFCQNLRRLSLSWRGNGISPISTRARLHKTLKSKFFT